MNIKSLVKIHWKEIQEKTIIHYPEVEDLCHRTYPNHPKGCPNIEKCQKLNIPSFDVINECEEYQYYYLLYGIFDRKGYRKQIGKNDNIRWWQVSLKNLLRDYIEELHSYNGEFYVFSSGSGIKFSFQRSASMEHCHINVFSTMKLNGVKLDLNPQNRVILCNLLCSKKPLKFKNGKQLSIEEFSL